MSRSFRRTPFASDRLPKVAAALPVACLALCCASPPPPPTTSAATPEPPPGASAAGEPASPAEPAAPSEPATVAGSAPREPRPGGAAPPPPRPHDAHDSTEDDPGRPHMLEFFGVGISERVANLGMGSGSTSDKLAEAVGRAGVVYSHGPRKPLPEDVQESPREQAARLALGNVIVKMSMSYETPLSPEAKDLDLVTFLFAYHDLITQGADRQKFHSQVFQALKPGRFYVIADFAAPAGTGPEQARSHRISSDFVRREVEAAGFEFVEAADLLRKARATAEGNLQVPRERYLLKFRKPLPR